MRRRGNRILARNPDMLIGVAIFILVWATRAIAANTFVTWDEPAWVFRSVHFLAALERGDWAHTMLVGHPGVVTMWVGAMGLALHRFVMNTIAASDWQAVSALAVLDVHDETTIRHLVALLLAAKSLLALAHAALAGVLWTLLRKLLDRPSALVAMGLVALDPYEMALSRVLHIDALTAQFMLMACLAALVYARPYGRRRYLVVSGLAVGLAVLTKSYGVLAAPIVALYWLVSWVRRPQDMAWEPRLRKGSPQARQDNDWRRALVLWARDVAMWALVAGAIFVLAWPAMWVTPLQALQSMLGLSFEYATRPGDATTAFFRGQTVADPGPWFYWVAMWFRATPLALVGSAWALLGLIVATIRRAARPWPRHATDGERDEATRETTEPRTSIDASPVSSASDPRRRRGPHQGASGIALALLLYALFYLAVITLSRKKFDRYMLPALLAGDVLAGIGLGGAIGVLWDRGARTRATQGVISALTGIVLVLAQAIAVLPSVAPSYYLAYYNPLAGGIRRAVQTIPVGWGEGVEQVAHYLAAREDAAHTNIATWAVAGIAPFFPGHVRKPDAEGLADADEVVLYIGDQQANSTLATGLGEPKFVAHVNGIPYAWVYPNDYDEGLGRQIDSHAHPGAVIVSNAASSLQRRKSSALPYRVIAGESEEQIAQALQQAGGQAPYLFYLEFSGVQESAALSIRRQLAQNALLLWQEPFTYGTLSYYRRAEGATFRAIQADRPTEGVFGQQLRLQRYGLSPGALQYRQEAGVALSWRAIGAPEHDYHIFLRLVDGDGRVWGSRDQPLQDDAARLSSQWGDQESHNCRFTVPLEPGIPPGEYWVSVGLYRLADLARLEIVGDDGSSRGTEMRLGPLQVTSPLEPPSVTELSIPNPLSARLGQGAELLGYDLAQRTYRSGEQLPLTLYWRALDNMPESYTLMLQLVQGETVAAESRAAPAGAGYPTERWSPGEVLRYPHHLLIPGETASGDYDVALNWIDGLGERLLRQNVALTRITVEYRERLFTPPAIEHPLNIRAGEIAELLGYSLTLPSARPGETLQLTLYWKALGPSTISYSVFTHLLDAGSAIRGQGDGIPVRGERPMTDWVAGEIIVDPYDITIDSDAVPGAHHIEIGVYDPANGQRVPLTGPDGVPLPDRRLLITDSVQIQ